MRQSLFIFFLLQCLVLGAISAQTPRTIYVFGLANELNDSTVYMTSIQQLDDAQLQKRTGFLLGRALYSSQLKTYVSKLGKIHAVSVVYYSKDKKKLAKKYQKMQREYLGEKSVNLCDLLPNQFSFQSIGKVSDNRVRLNDDAEVSDWEGE